jgi:hypothetical protein
MIVHFSVVSGLRIGIVFSEAPFDLVQFERILETYVESDEFLAMN